MKIYMKKYERGISLESYIILHVYKNYLNYSRRKDVEVWLVEEETDNQELLFDTDCSNFRYVGIGDVPETAFYCKWPVAVIGNTVIAGLAAVARHLLKHSNDDGAKALLGFRTACLLACSEVSVWTKFCEVDIIATVKDVVQNSSNYVRDTVIFLPAELTRFEYHLSQPIRIHNVYKLARSKNKNNRIPSNTPITALNLGHTYSEGPFMTLADLLLLPCFKIIFKVFGDTFADALPLTNTWYNHMCEITEQINLTLRNTYNSVTCTVLQEVIEKQSLYRGNAQACRKFTKQEDVDKVVASTQRLSAASPKRYIDKTQFPWENLPLEANPLSGALPVARAGRKCEQLENLAKATVKLAGNRSCTIVDFCSGSGHLGILLASILQKCNIILVENKERSLERARERIYKMKLKNITIVQSNLDYFVAPFDIGTALHACGVAADLVIQSCIKSKADFVVCPCCYGGIQNCHHLSYPRSNAFMTNAVTYTEYLILGHASDQTHDGDNLKTSQGFVCMDIIDSDRKLYAEEQGYTVYLNKLIPPSCTPKNNLLIGIHKVC